MNETTTVRNLVLRSMNIVLERNTIYFITKLTVLSYYQQNFHIIIFSYQLKNISQYSHHGNIELLTS